MIFIQSYIYTYFSSLDRSIFIVMIHTILEAKQVYENWEKNDIGSVNLQWHL